MRSFYQRDTSMASMEIRSDWVNICIIYHSRATSFTPLIFLSVCMINIHSYDFVMFSLLFHFAPPPPPRPRPPLPLTDLLFLSFYPADLKQTSPHIRIESTQGFFLLKGSFPLGFRLWVQSSVFRQLLML